MYIKGHQASLCCVCHGNSVRRGGKSGELWPLTSSYSLSVVAKVMHGLFLWLHGGRMVSFSRWSFTCVQNLQKTGRQVGSYDNLYICLVSTWFCSLYFYICVRACLWKLVLSSYHVGSRDWLMSSGLAANACICGVISGSLDFCCFSLLRQWLTV